MKMTRLFSLLAFLSSQLFLTQLVFGTERIDFNTQVRPILSDRCFLCHGPDGENREADLRLDQEADAHKAVEFATAPFVIKPGSPDESEVFLRIISDDSSVKMPPPDSNLSLTDSEIDILRKWIEQGAEYDQHWSFRKPVAPELPEVSDPDWPQQDLDRFILRKLDQAGLAPNPPATKEKWIRRVTFDLTGLPPTLEEIYNFLADDSDRSYEKVVDRLFQSERYGERMASDWLDVARYSDTYGYQVDRDRYVWPWRDWVIRSFNKNTPYDQFITEQIAGDLLPNATDDQILATTFNRLHPQKVEGGSTPEEFRIEYVADRTQTFGTAFLGLTFECCRCHDHKFDPLSQAEYFQLSAFFDNIDEAGLYSYFTPAVPTPTLLLSTPEQKLEIASLEESVVKSETKLQRIAKKSVGKFDQWLSQNKTEKVQLPEPLLHLDFETVSGRNRSVEGVTGKAAQLTGDDSIDTEVGNFQRSQPFSISLWLKTPDVKERAVILHRSRAWTDAGSRGYELLIEDGKLKWSLIHFWPGNAISIRTADLISTNDWHHVTVTYDGSSRADGLNIFVDSKKSEVDTIRDGLKKTIQGGGGDNIAIGERFRDRGFKNGTVDELRVFDRELTPGEVQALTNLESPESSSSDLLVSSLSQKEAHQYFLQTQHKKYQSALSELQKDRKRLNDYIETIPEIMVMRELPKQKPTYRLIRGNYDTRGEQVHPATPAVLPPLTDSASANRLALAKWLTSPDHPLTARVTVNRIWQMVFGSGLVATPEDFGSQGSNPSHPELLDWLAVRFMDQGWDLQQLLKQIVLSATYRQSSQVRSDQMKIDPENLLLSRSPSYRMPAEMLRDNALAVSGLLVNRVGGPPAKPYEVAVSFKPAEPDTGEGLYRRSVYTYWKRTGPAPDMTTLDASKRDVCQVKRERTSSPLQALVMLNGPQFVEAARLLAERLMVTHRHDDQFEVDDILTDLFRMLTSRYPTEQEREVLHHLYESQLANFQQQPEDAEEYLNVGQHERNKNLPAPEHAAVTSIANALLNLDECVIKR
ncbi:Planctomycete cytochrome C [Thalassoglobus neptunius]|uniref:Planctomycete cytochrome C n=1 Tax=Thalassoglobus neptunius TaxID=1938619 RepID=A0A5C5WQK4_9PLAN|nr:DUF1553 domain-containing protein [Thalassoglobus neptunius]TWT52072.1 Planctomycete cytochrome C [Thalassoglobus neptunius]